MRKELLLPGFMVGFLIFQCMKVSAAETNAIESLRFDPVEIHYGDINDIGVASGDVLGEMPIPIVDDSDNGFIKILLPDGREAWVNRADVQVGGVETKAICAKAKRYSKTSDHSSAHLRGISRDCN